MKFAKIAFFCLVPCLLVFILRGYIRVPDMPPWVDFLFSLEMAEPVSSSTIPPENVGEYELNELVAPVLLEQNSADKPINTQVDRKSDNSHLSQIITISGSIHYERLNFIDRNPFQIRDSADLTLFQLDRDNPEILPSRSIVVSLVSAGKVVASVVTDESGAYQIDYVADAPEQQFHIVVWSILQLDSDTWDSIKVSVRDPSKGNRADRPSLYAAYSEPFQAEQQTVQRNFHFKAELIDEWQDNTSSQYKSQPFAILDTIRKAADYIAQKGVTAPAYGLKDFNVYWSQHAETQPSVARAAGAYHDGREPHIYLSAGEVALIPWRGKRVVSEWSEATIIHEFGHYILKNFVGRDDTQGGHHTLLGMGSLTLAFSEGFANALSYAVLGTGKNYQAYVGDAGTSATRNYMSCDLLVQKDKNGLPIYQHSPFSETTVTRFLLSLIDTNFDCHDSFSAEFPTTIGLKGVILALRQSLSHEALLTIYSFAESLARQFPQKQSELYELGRKLDITLGNAWGDDEQAIEAIYDPAYSAGLEDESYLPLYVPLKVGRTQSLAFNASLANTSIRRPGTERYVRLEVEPGRDVFIQVFDAADNAGRRHRFSFDVYWQGELLAHSQNSSMGTYQYVRFTLDATVDEAQTIVLGVLNQRFSATDDFDKNETIVTKVTAKYLDE